MKFIFLKKSSEKSLIKFNELQNNNQAINGVNNELITQKFEKRKKHFMIFLKSSGKFSTISYQRSWPSWKNQAINGVKNALVAQRIEKI